MKIVEPKVDYVDLHLSKIEHSRFISRFMEEYTHVQGHTNFVYKGRASLNSKISNSPLSYIKRK